MAADDVVLPEDPAPTGLRRQRWRGRRGRTALVLIGVLVLALLIAWTQRRPIATDVINQRLAAWGVPARYKVAQIGFREQRLTDVVIGDPAHPDLVADWVSVDTSLSVSGAQIIGVRAGHVRLRGRLVNGTLSLGAIDKLLPPPSGKPFSLPAIDLSVDDARMRLETPQGVVGIKLSGTGRLDNGFTGDLAAISEQIETNGCRADRVTAVVGVRIIDAQPHLDGPVRAATLSCGGVAAQGVQIDQRTALGEALDNWQGSASVHVGALRQPGLQIAGLSGTLGYTGSARQTHGTADLIAAQLAVPQGAARNARVAGNYQIGKAANGQSAIRLDGQASALLVVAARWRQALARLHGSAAGTPLGPLIDRLSTAAVAAARDVSVSGKIALSIDGAAGSLGLSGVEARSASGALLTFSGEGLGYRWPGGAPTAAGLLALSGGGLPDAAVTLRSDGKGGVTGTGLVRRFSAADAQLAMDDLAIRIARNGAAQITTRLALSGPVAGGRVDGLRLPITATIDPAGRLAVNRGCAPIGFDRLRLVGMDLRPARATLCPAGGALLTLASGKAGGGGRIDGLRLTGAVGGSPLSLAAGQVGFAVDKPGFALSGVAVRLGNTDKQTRLNIASLRGQTSGKLVGGGFTGAGGQIGGVPLVMSAGAGDWQFGGGVLSLKAAMTVADADPDPRFEPLSVPDVALTLKDSRIDATGTLRHPASGAAVAGVVLTHDLSKGTGYADLSVNGLHFGATLQPDQLTPLTKGVIANVVATITGEGHIGWTRDGVTSDGVFRTEKADLAALFGPVSGLSTEIHFTDLLNLVSASDQVATVAVVNPGVAAENGVVHYALLPDQKVDVRGAEWPFAGGRLTLEPTLLDFAEHRERRLTFRVAGIDAAQFLQQFDFKNLNATGTFDGVLPMIFTDRGGRIEGGHLIARAGGGSIAYVGEVSQKDVGFWGNMAFQALKSLNYRNLDIDMNGPLDGEVITVVRFAGVSQGKGAKSNFLIKRLAHLPFVFNVRIQAPFRQLLDSVQGYYDPSRLIKRNLPALIQAQREAEERAKAAAPQAHAAPLPKAAQPIQPPESEDRP